MQALDFSSSICKDFQNLNEGNVPKACDPINYGFLPNGASCRLWNQCASGRCIALSTAECGQCVPRQPAGGPCGGFADGLCDFGTECRGPEMAGICAKYREVGQTCDDNASPCHRLDFCNHGVCDSKHADGSCDPSLGASNGCPLSPSFQYCSAAGRCEPIPIARQGEHCAFDQPEFTTYGRALNCVHGTSCAVVNTTGDPYECTPLIEDGSACNAKDELGSPCTNPDSSCFKNKCQVSGPAECSAPTVLP